MRSAMMPITTSNSINVKAGLLDGFMGLLGKEGPKSRVMRMFAHATIIAEFVHIVKE